MLSADSADCFDGSKPYLKLWNDKYFCKDAKFVYFESQFYMSIPCRDLNRIDKLGAMKDLLFGDLILIDSAFALHIWGEDSYREIKVNLLIELGCFNQWFCLNETSGAYCPIELRGDETRKIADMISS